MKKQPIKKYFGNLNRDELAKAFKTDKVKTTEKFGTNLTIQGAMCDDGGISLTVWNGEEKVSIKIGNLKESKDYAPAPNYATSRGEQQSITDNNGEILPF